MELDSLGNRLRSAIRRWHGGQTQGSILAFQRKLEERAVPGSSYSSVHNYLRDRAKPAPAFVEAAAAILQVRPEWLESGEGSPLPEEEARPTYSTPREIGEKVGAAFREGAPFTTRLWEWQGEQIWRAWIRYSSSKRAKEDEGDFDSEAFTDTALDFARALSAPMEILGVNPEELSGWQLESYTTLLCQAFSTIMPEISR